MTDYTYEDELHAGRLDLGLWRRILVHALPYRWPILGMALSGLVLAAADALLPLVTAWVIDDATSPDGTTSALAGHSLQYVGLVVTFALLVWFFIVLAGRIATGLAYDIRRAAFARLQDLSYSFYDTRPVGWLMARLTSDCQRLANILPWFLLDMVWGTSFLLMMCGMMLWLNWKLALAVMLVLPPLTAASIVFQRMLLKSQRHMRKTNSLLTASFNEGIMGTRTTKTLVREAENLEEFRVLSGQMWFHSIRNRLQSAVYLPLVLSLGSAGVGLALWRGGLQLGEGMTFGTLVAFMQYAALMWMPVQEMAERFTQFQAAQASAERLQQLLDTEPEIRDSPEVAAAVARGEHPEDEKIEEIHFDDVSFSYVPEEPVLSGFDLRVGAGETIALVGATGSGKTTIVSLVGRFYEPTAGSLRINGVDYRDRSLNWLQSNLGIVLQTPHLFSGSVRDNIRYGRLDATDEEVREAARQVYADRFIRELDQGYDTDVGEGGSRLSIGQKQLVSLARAVLADPQIFIMDEATSSVDTETEKMIQRGIETVLEGRISFIIAHRLSTIRSADRILVIDRGRILEEGDHRSLMKSRGRYHALYTQQFARESQQRALESLN